MAEYEGHELSNGDILLKKTVKTGGGCLLLFFIPLLLFFKSCDKIGEWKQAREISKVQAIIDSEPFAAVIEEGDRRTNENVTKAAVSAKPETIKSVTHQFESSGSTTEYADASWISKPIDIPPPLALKSFTNLDNSPPTKDFTVVYTVFSGATVRTDCVQWLRQHGYKTPGEGVGTTVFWDGKATVGYGREDDRTLLPKGGYRDGPNGFPRSIHLTNRESNAKVTFYYRNGGHVYVWSSHEIDGTGYRDIKCLRLSDSSSAEMTLKALLELKAKCQ